MPQQGFVLSIRFIAEALYFGNIHCVDVVSFCFSHIVAAVYTVVQGVCSTSLSGYDPFHAAV
jgi:hypothetical protein